MLDPKYVYENVEYIRKVCKDKFVECDLDAFVRLYEDMKNNQKELDNLNMLKKQAAEARDAELGKKLKERGPELEEKARQLEEQFKIVAETVPNLYSPDTPYGTDDEENVVLRKR
jgi:seryl-tRNA synthetase